MKILRLHPTLGWFAALGWIAALPALADQATAADTMSLAGSWAFRIDRDDQGVQPALVEPDCCPIAWSFPARCNRRATATTFRSIRNGPAGSSTSPGSPRRSMRNTGSRAT